MLWLALTRIRILPMICKLMVSQAGFEPATNGLEIRCSIQLSYWDR